MPTATAAYRQSSTSQPKLPTESGVMLEPSHPVVYIAPDDAVAAGYSAHGLIGITPENEIARERLLPGRCAVIVIVDGAAPQRDWAYRAARSVCKAAAEVRIVVVPAETTAGVTAVAKTPAAIGNWLWDEPRAPEVIARATAAVAPWRDSDADTLDALLGGFVVPSGYRISMRGVEAERVCRTARRADDGSSNEWVPVTVAPVWFSRRFADDTGGDVAVQLCMHYEGRTIRRVLPLEALSTAAHIPKLSTLGFIGFDSVSAPGIVSYLRHALRANLGTLPLVRTTQTLGSSFDRDGMPLDFVFGGMRYLPGGVTEEVELSPLSSVRPERYAAFHQRGTSEGWAELVRELRVGNYWMVYTSLCAAVASLLNRPLHRDPFTVELAGESSCGKTTALRLVQSVVGSPNAVHSMKSTANAMEATFGMHGNLPIFLDELKSFAQERGVDQDKALSDLTYTISQGEGKDRLTKTIAQRPTFSWSANALLTGEMDVGDASVDAGGKVRCIVLWGMPFHERSDAAVEVQDRLFTIARAHYGWAVPMVAQRLLTFSADDWAALRAEYRMVARRYAREQTPKCLDRAVASRMADAFAALELAGRLLEEVFPTAFRIEDERPDGLPTTQELLAEAWAAQCTRMGTVLRVQRSIDTVLELYTSRKQDFVGAPFVIDAPYSRGTIGRVLTVNGIEQLAILKGELDTHLRAKGFRLDTESKHWRDAGLILVDAEGNTTRNVRINGVPNRCVVFDLSKLEALARRCYEPMC